MKNKINEPLLDMYVFETLQLLEQLEQIIIGSEKSAQFTQDTVNEIFRIMHTIKGSSAMMNCNSISSLAHSVEDLFYIIRENNLNNFDKSNLCDNVLECIDFIKAEILKIEKGENENKNAMPLIEKIRAFSSSISGAKQETNPDMKKTYASMHEKETSAKNVNIENEPSENIKSYKAVVFFEEGCEMENIRSHIIIKNLKDIATEITYHPEDIISNNDTAEIIQKEGFHIWFKSECSFGEIQEFFSQTIFLKDLELNELTENKTTDEVIYFGAEMQTSGYQSDYSLSSNCTGEKNTDRENVLLSSQQSLISVNVSKLDILMDLIGELVISASMVEQNPDLSGLSLENFQKAARNHNKIIHELQDIAMSIRMVPLSATMQKMNRIVRDMSRKLSKEVTLNIVGEETEVDKNIIDHISDPLMHLIRNSIDHGIETAEERKSKGKPETGVITLEAKNAGGDVLITIRDDGRGLDKEKILSRAKTAGILNKPENEISDREIYSYIFLPGFSTNTEVTEFSGRGVGMDVVTKNISAIGGAVAVDSRPGEGMAITLKIPLTLAIMGGMIIRVGLSTYTIPMISIRESFKAEENSVITDPDGNEMMMIRGECCPVIRLHKLYNVWTEITNISEGIVIMVENNGKGICIFADKLIGEQQVVVKALPDYIKNIKKAKGVAGCTLLGDGSISLIIDIADLVEERR